MPRLPQGDPGLLLGTSALAIETRELANTRTGMRVVMVTVFEEKKKTWTKRANNEQHCLMKRYFCMCVCVCVLCKIFHLTCAYVCVPNQEAKAEQLLSKPQQMMVSSSLWYSVPHHCDCDNVQ